MRLHRTVGLVSLVGMCVLVATSTRVGVADGPVNKRPISDWVDVQGTYCIPNPDGSPGCFLFVPPVQNFVAWTDPFKNLWCPSITPDWWTDTCRPSVPLNSGHHSTARSPRSPSRTAGPR